MLPSKCTVRNPVFAMTDGKADCPIPQKAPSNVALGLSAPMRKPGIPSYTCT